VVFCGSRVFLALPSSVVRVGFRTLSFPLAGWPASHENKPPLLQQLTTTLDWHIQIKGVKSEW
jgi:hypothetical protein